MPSEYDAVLEVTPAVAAWQTLTCPVCNSEYQECLSDDAAIAGADCPECGAHLKYDYGDDEGDQEPPGDQATLGGG